MGTIVVAMLSAYVLGLCLGLSPWLSLLLGWDLAFSSLNVLYLSAGHATKVRAIATMPGVLAGVILAYRGRMWAERAWRRGSRPCTWRPTTSK